MQFDIKPILGDVTAFTITTPDPEQSLAFYQKLGFSELFRSDFPFPLIQISDGAIQIMLRKDNTPYIALTYYVLNIDAVVADLEAKGIEFAYRPSKADAITRYLIKSPDGLTVSLVGMINGFAQPAGPTMLKMDQKDYFNPEKYVNKACGMFGEFAHPVTDLEQSLAFWEKLGFKSVTKFTSPYPWAIVSDGLSVVGLHQSKHFNYPAITYFAADMQDKIAKLKEAGLTDIKDQGPANAVVTTPEQQHIFLYKLGM